MKTKSKATCPMFEITVGGQYLCGDRKNVQVETFEETFTLPFSGGEALSAIRRKLIEPRLKNTKKQYRGVRTCAIVNVSDTKGALLKIADIPKFTLDQLSQFAAENKMVIVPWRYSVDTARDLTMQELERKAKAAKKPKTSKPKGPSKQDMAGDRGMEFDEILE